MKITLKLFATLRDYLPADAVENGVEVHVADDATPNELIDEYKIPRQLAHLVLLNGIYIEPHKRDVSLFKEGDTLAIWPPVAGGQTEPNILKPSSDARYAFRNTFSGN